jgi:hypothetical protein
MVIGNLLVKLTNRYHASDSPIAAPKELCALKYACKLLELCKSNK